MNPSLRVWLVMLSLALFVHFGLAQAIFSNDTTKTNASVDEGVNGFEVGYGQLGAYKDARKRLEAVKQKKVELQEETEEPLKPVKEVRQKDPAKPIDVAETQEIKVAKKTPVEFDEHTTKHQLNVAVSAEREDVEKAQPMPSDEIVEEKKDSNEEELAKERLDSSEQKDMALASGKKQQKNLGGKKGDANRYFTELKNWLNEHKEYPPHLRKAKIQGVVTVKFTIDSAGKLKASSIKKSSGSEILDQSAIAMLIKADPMPPFPNSFNRDQLTISLPIEYALIDE